MEIIDAPTIEPRSARPYLGIGMITPFRGMLSVRDKLWSELFAWCDQRGVPCDGGAFLRLNVVDMRGFMDLEVRVLIDAPVLNDERVGPSILPGGDYATMAYRDHSIRANSALIDWVKTQGREFDHRVQPTGDHFASRYELNLTDPRSEPRKTRWIVQLNFLLTDPD